MPLHDLEDPEEGRHRRMPPLIESLRSPRASASRPGPGGDLRDVEIEAVVTHAGEQALEDRGFERWRSRVPAVGPLLEERRAEAVELDLAHRGRSAGGRGRGT